MKIFFPLLIFLKKSSNFSSYQTPSKVLGLWISVSYKSPLTSNVVRNLSQANKIVPYLIRYSSLGHTALVLRYISS